jgi:23S rRNA (pseudouridine1915-N3)-methyltransferase
MRISLLTVGRCRDRAVADLSARYAARIARYADFSEQSVAEAPPSIRNTSEATAAEARRLLGRCPPGSAVIALHPAGEMVPSDGLALRLQRLCPHGDSRIAFLIGGPLGLGAEVLSKCDWRWSLSPLTFPHDLVRVLLLEQIYRALTILKGEAYHK